jgi:hypothetical protein
MTRETQKFIGFVGLSIGGFMLIWLFGSFMAEDLHDGIPYDPFRYPWAAVIAGLIVTQIWALLFFLGDFPMPRRAESKRLKQPKHACHDSGAVCSTCNGCPQCSCTRGCSPVVPKARIIKD